MNACKSLNARPAKAIEREASNNETTTEAFNYLAKTLAKVVEINLVAIQTKTWMTGFLDSSATLRRSAWMMTRKLISLLIICVAAP